MSVGVQSHLRAPLLKVLTLLTPFFPYRFTPCEDEESDDCTYILSDEMRSFRLRVCIRGMSRFAWIQERRWFDVDTLCRNARSMYITQDASYLFLNRPSHPSALVSGRPDLLQYVSGRTLARRFCLIHPERTERCGASLYAHGTTRGQRWNSGGEERETLAERMDRAYELVKSGWTMDTANGVVSWWICPWWILVYPNPYFGALLSGSLSYAGMRQNDRRPPRPESEGVLRQTTECALCHELIGGTDIVMRLQCGHVFHCRCGEAHSSRRETRGTGTEGSTTTLHHDERERKEKKDDGIIRWFKQEDKRSCPLCRVCLCGGTHR